MDLGRRMYYLPFAGDVLTEILLMASSECAFLSTISCETTGASILSASPLG